MEINKRKEDFSKSYLCAIAARCGWAVGTWSQDEFKIDTSLCKEITNDDETNEVLHLDFQLKCTESPTTDNKQFVSFTLTQKHFDKLSRRVGGKPMMLVVMVVPKELDAWFNLYQHGRADAHLSTKLQFCGYGALISDDVDNYLEDAQTIRFKKGLDEFDAKALTTIESKIRSREYRALSLRRQAARVGEQI